MRVRMLIKKEQISTVLRYCYNNQVYVSFMGFKAAVGGARSLARSILETYIWSLLENYIWSRLRIASRWPGYGGASVMSDVNKGLQQIIRECTPDVCVHCFARRPDLLLVDSYRAVAGGECFFHY